MKNDELVTEMEVADIIFNSKDAGLNDVLISSLGKHDFKRIFRNIAIRINAAHAHLLVFGLDKSGSRREFLKEKIKSELTFYAAAPMKKDLDTAVEWSS